MRIAINFHLQKCFGRAISYGSYFYNPNTWFSGIIIFFFLMATAFMGYVLPFGQFMFFAALVSSFAEQIIHEAVISHRPVMDSHSFDVTSPVKRFPTIEMKIEDETRPKKRCPGHQEISIPFQP